MKLSQTIMQYLIKITEVYLDMSWGSYHQIIACAIRIVFMKRRCLRYSRADAERLKHPSRKGCEFLSLLSFLPLPC